MLIPYLARVEYIEREILGRLVGGRGSGSCVAVTSSKLWSASSSFLWFICKMRV